MYIILQKHPKKTRIVTGGDVVPVYTAIDVATTYAKACEIVAVDPNNRAIQFTVEACEAMTANNGVPV